MSHIGQLSELSQYILPTGVLGMVYILIFMKKIQINNFCKSKSYATEKSLYSLSP